MDSYLAIFLTTIAAVYAVAKLVAVLLDIYHKWPRGR
jgi:hypothetical protein